MDEERLTNLEIKLTHLEHTLETLNAVVMEQAERVDALARRLEDALERRADGAAGPAGDPLDERPPHY